MLPDEKVKQVTITVTPAQAAFLQEVMFIGPQHVHTVLTALLRDALHECDLTLDDAPPTSKQFGIWLHALQLLEPVAAMIHERQVE